MTEQSSTIETSTLSDAAAQAEIVLRGMLSCMRPEHRTDRFGGARVVAALRFLDGAPPIEPTRVDIDDDYYRLSDPIKRLANIVQMVLAACEDDGGNLGRAEIDQIPAWDTGARTVALAKFLAARPDFRTTPGAVGVFGRCGLEAGPLSALLSEVAPDAEAYAAWDGD